MSRSKTPQSMVMREASLKRQRGLRPGKIILDTPTTGDVHRERREARVSRSMLLK